MKYHFTYQIPNESIHEKGQRIDVFLVEQLNDQTRTFIRKLIDQGKISVNSATMNKANYRLRHGDVIELEIVEQKADYSKARFLELDIIDEQTDFLVINKPAGLLVHQATSSGDQISLVNGLLYHFKEFAQFDDTQRPGIVHRLDKNTSGLILVARNLVAQAKLSQLFKDRAIKKTYQAIVQGHPDKIGTIEYSIGRHLSQRHKMSHIGFAARPSKTDYEVITYYDDGYSFVQAYPLTGRTHQIRVHFAAIGHPLLGDAMYGKPSKTFKRHALHAHKLEFEYEGKPYSYTCPLPADMQKVLDGFTESEVVEL